MWSDNTESQLSSTAVAEQNFTFSSEAASQAQKRLALVVVLGLFLIFVLLLGPFSNIQTGRIQAFVPVYTMAIFVTDAITAVFLFAEFSIVRTRALLAISSGYLFNALIVLAWYLTFPDLFVPGSLLGGLQSTPYIHFFWHAGFPISVIVYALLKGRPGSRCRLIGHSRKALKGSGEKAMLRTMLNTQARALLAGKSTDGTEACTASSASVGLPVSH